MSDEYRDVEFVSDAAGERLDKAIAAHVADLSRAQVQNLIHDGLVTVNDRPAKAAHRLEGGETIRVRVPIVEADEAKAEHIPLVVLYEDAQVAVVDKPAGMVVHPALGHTSGTLVNAVLARWPAIGEFSEPGRAGIVHRLDKETSGVLLIAKTSEALAHLREQFKARTVKKHYIALVEGMPQTPEGLIDAPIGRDPNQRKRMSVTREGREAVTEYYVRESYAYHSLLDVYPQTGRTHQIRVHLAFIGCPVVGDNVYGPRKQRIKMKRYFLHAAGITFSQPVSGEPLTVEAPLPASLRNVLEKLPR